MKFFVSMIVALIAVNPATPTATFAGELKAGAASKTLTATDDQVIGGSIGPVYLKGQEGELRASALVLEGPDGVKACLVACDVLMVNRDILDVAAHTIAEKTGVPFEAILINATHTHHAPTTVSVHGYTREEAFTKQLGEKIVEIAPKIKASPGAREIDAGGMAVSPGFIELHTHYDTQITWDRKASPAAKHGVTTVVAGGCSLSLAPVLPAGRQRITDIFYKIEDLRNEYFEAAVPYSWESFGQYLDFIRPGLGINVAPVVGHSALRM